MTDTMKERIARGQAEFDGRGWLHMHSADRRRYLQRVDLFLDVMREPEVEMLAAFWRQKNNGTQEIGERGEATDDYSAYRAMIDHIRSEGKE